MVTEVVTGKADELLPVGQAVHLANSKPPVVVEIPLTLDVARVKELTPPPPLP